MLPLSERFHLTERSALIVLLLSIAIGGWIRVSNLDGKSISHPEMYVPGIRLPEGISEPGERMTIRRVLTGTFSSDTHPPGYYLMMLGWTRVMGTSLTALRLPSALLGLACVPLLYALGALAGSRSAGSIAAALLALSGYHVFWSKVARMFALECFLGLSTTVLILLIVKGLGRKKWLLPLYVALSVFGVASHVFYWSLLLTQLVWTFLNSSGARRMPAIFRAELLALILGSPFIAFAIYQSGTTVAELSSNGFAYLISFLSFSFAFPTADSGFFHPTIPLSGSVWLRGAAFVFGLFLSVLGLRRLLAQRSEGAGSLDAADSWPLAWVGAGVLGSAVIAGFVYMSSMLPPEFVHGTIRITKALTPLPIALTSGAILLDHFWERMRRLLPGKFGESVLIALLALMPFALLAGISLFRPLLNQRGLLLLSPYLLLTIGFGASTLSSRNWFTIGPLLAATIVIGLMSYRGMTVDPIDYKDFADRLRIGIQPGDLVFMRKTWYQTPILYYLSADRYRLVGHDYARASTSNPDAPVWVVLLYDSDPSVEMRAALAGYLPVRTIAVDRCKAMLFRRPTFLSQTFDK